MMRVLLLILFVLSINLNSFGQKPKNGIYLLKYFDLEYNKFAGTCKWILNNDSIATYAEKDCHRTPGALIEKGALKKNKTGDWIVYRKEEDMPSKIDFKKKIYYSF